MLLKLEREGGGEGVREKRRNRQREKNRRERSRKKSGVFGRRRPKENKPISIEKP